MNIKNLRLLSPRSIYVCLILFVAAQCALAQAIRPIDGFGNNQDNPMLGATGDLQDRLSPSFYLDGIGEPVSTSNSSRPNPREVSNKLFSQEGLVSDPLSLSDFTWVFGQFIDHDITLVENGNEPMLDIVVPADDPVFAVGSVIPMMRNAVAEGTGTTTDNPRQFENSITAFVDGSAIYGSDDEVADWLRSHVDGKLKVSPGNLLPWNTVDLSYNSAIDHEAPEMENNSGMVQKYFVAGDIRANENPLLIAMHTLFVREHNRQCDIEKQIHPGWNDERLYQAARKTVIAELQNIVYYEWMPAIGLTIPQYTGYKTTVTPRIFNEFSAAAFRMGHTLINSNIIRIDDRGQELGGGHIELKDAFFNPLVVALAGGIDPYLKGMATQVQQDFDCKVVDDVRNFLFGAPGQGGLDLAAININRGRDRGLPGYNGIRRQLGLPPFSTFEELTNSAEDAAIMKEVYTDIDNLDPWVGMLAESRDNNDALFGKVVSLILERQFQMLRDGDRFYFENDQFDEEKLEQIRNVTMRDIIMNNSDITLMQDEVFRAMPHEQIEEGPSLIAFPLDAVIYPNPIGDVLNIKVYADVESDADVTIMDYLGNTILTYHAHLYEGSNYVSIPLADCPRGYYNVMLENGRQFKILKMIKE